MKFSVLLSLYIKESPEYLRSALSSVFEQTVKASEVVLVEDGPITEELSAVVDEFAKAYEEMKVVKLAVNGGLGNALNEGLKYCSHELVARMDTDDICKPNRFEEQLKVFEVDSSIDVCSSWIDEFSRTKDEVVSQRRLPETHEQIVDYAKTRCPVNHVTVMYRRSVVIAIGGYQGFPEDYYLWISMIHGGYKFYNIQKSLVWVRFSPDVLKRRGGWAYAKDDIRAQWNFYKIGFLTKSEFLKNVVIRGTVRLMPNGLRLLIYRSFLRK